jgi:hypothetical protein
VCAATFTQQCSCVHVCPQAQSKWLIAYRLCPFKGAAEPDDRTGRTGKQRYPLVCGAGSRTGVRRSRDGQGDGIDVTARHLERVEWVPYPDVDLEGWPFTVPVVRQLIAERGLEIPAGVTVLLGENGSGKSTLTEAIAAIYPRAGFEASHARMSGPEVLVDDHRDEAPLRWHLKARTNPLASPAGFFLRAELLHDYLDRVDRDPRQRRAWGTEPLLDRSHGETFLDEPQRYLRHLSG